MTSNGKTNGSGSHDDGTSGSDAAPQPVAELSAACMRYVATRYGVMLDFRPETLSLLDQYVADGRKEIEEKRAQGDATGADGTATLVSAAAGAYLGEVIRHELGGMWFSEGEHDGWRLDMETVYLTFNPIGMMREALELGESRARTRTSRWTPRRRMPSRTASPRYRRWRSPSSTRRRRASRSSRSPWTPSGRR
jgi:hypothetical protein